MSEKHPSPLFQPWQKKILAAALSVLAAAFLIAIVVYFFTLLGQALSTFSHVLWPLAVAGILALMLRPAARYLEQRGNLSPPLAVTVLYAAVVTVLGVVSWLTIPVLVQQIGDGLRSLPELFERAWSALENRFPETAEKGQNLLDFEKLEESLSLLMESGQEWLSTVGHLTVSAGARLWGVVSLITGLAIIPIYLFFFLQSDKEPTSGLNKHLSFLPDGIREDLIFLIREFIAIVISFFRGQVLIGLIMAVLLAIGFSVLGLKFSLIIGLTLGILNIIPYLGTILGFVITIPLALFQPDGGVWLALSVGGVFVVVQAFESWFLTPRIMGQRTGLHPVVIIIAIFFWGTALGGILGMVLAIPLTAFFVIFWRLLRQKYLPLLSST